ncbi:hypothetical protein [Spiroplasma endosymbiont of Polydrusus pterygomalis]|uniref:hypothetical protein n=1 Tax=Spiroplasma endosymbiont of Polydrusus pterygomalis TaxID=3139327 RepID=UPI003CCB4407
MKNKIITLLQNYEINLNINFPIFGLALYQLLKREFINNLIFGEENYSILHIAVLNDWLNLVFSLISNWLIDVNYKDNSGNTAWNYACMLLQPKIVLLIKTKDQLMRADKQFLKQLSSISTNWKLLVAQENNKLASVRRNEIISW